MRDPAGWTCESWAVDSSEAAALSSHLLLHAESVDQIASEMAGVADLGWESPAGRNYSEYVRGQVLAVRRASDLLQVAASRVRAAAADLRDREYATFSSGQGP